jgi:hypothetical protein
VTLVQRSPFLLSLNGTIEDVYGWYGTLWVMSGFLIVPYVFTRSLDVRLGRGGQYQFVGRSFFIRPVCLSVLVIEWLGKHERQSLF